MRCPLACVLPLVAVLTGVSALVAEPAAPPGETPRFDAPRLTLHAGAQRAVALRLSGTASGAAESSDPEIAEVTRQPDPRTSHGVAFLRVRARKPGACEIRAGGASLPVVVLPANGALPRPRVTGPAPGAAAWGSIVVTVALEDPEESGRAFDGDLVLKLSDGRTLRPQHESDPAAGPTRRAIFVVDTSAGRGSRLELEPVWRTGGESGREEVVGEPIDVAVLHPSDSDVVAFEAESQIDVTRPERFKRPVRRGAIGADPAASGGKFLNNAGSEPVFCFPVHVDTPGFYQAILTARGTFAGGAFPTVGLVVDGAQYAATNARVPDDAWRRFTLGVPVRLEPGDHVLAAYFENDFYVAHLADRNLFLDKIEIVRVPAGVGVEAPAAGSSAMMPGAMSPAKSGEGAGDGAAGGAMRMPAMAGAGSPATTGDAADDPWGLDSRGVRVAFARPLDGASAGGELAIDGLCWWEHEDAPAPMVTLELNSKMYASQRAAAARFIIDPADLNTGDNTIRLVAALDSGAVDRTPLQHVTWETPPPAAKSASAPSRRRYLRYTIHEPGWDDVAAKHLSRDKNPPERRAVEFDSNAEAALVLPDDLTGKFDVFIESWGQEFGGPPILTAALVTEETRTPIGETAVQGWWNARRAGTVELPAGKKKIAIAFTNDKYEEKKGDRNVWFQAVVLHEAAPADTGAPVAALLYPPPDTRVADADAVVASFRDDRACARVELMVDDHPTGVSLDVAGQPSPVLLPLVTRELADGPHTLGVRVTDAAGHTADSSGVGVLVAHARGAEPTRYERAVRLLNRLGYGPAPEELADVLIKGDDAWLRDALAATGDGAGGLAALGAGLVRFPHSRGEYEVARRPIAQAILTRNTVRARFTFWVENHFSTWIRKTEADRKWREHVAFAKAGAAPFYDLLLTSATSPAMLRYLDQEQSYAGRLNENYAREIMELHTLGVDAGYTQADVTSLAHLLTGWTTAREGDGSSAGEMRDWSFTFDPALSEGGAVRVLGVEFPEASPGERYDRVRYALEILAAHPATARFVCRKLVEHYLSDPAPADIVEDLARRFSETGGDMAEVMIALVHHPRFTAADIPDRLAHPMEYALRVARTTHNANPWMIADFLQRSGSGLFDRSTPDGYPEQDSAYVDSNALLQRWRFARDNQWSLITLVPDTMRYGALPKDAAEAERWMQCVVDLISVRLTGRVLSADSNAAALDMLRSTSGDKQNRLLQLGPFIAQLPESNLR